MKKRILIVADVAPESTRGNRITALRWKDLISQLGYRVVFDQIFHVGQTWDALIALHARHSKKSIADFREENPLTPIIICLTGTDLHRDFSASAKDSSIPQTRQHYQAVLDSLEIANTIILLEPEGMKRLPKRFHKKCHVILQSAVAVSDPPKPPDDCFLVTVAGHLREIKDPFRTAMALKKLPLNSRIKVIHFGQALSTKMQHLAEDAMKADSRYQWIGPISHDDAMRRIASSHLTVLSSIHEGAPSVISEAVVNRIPILVTRIDAAIGLMGAGFPGIFEVGNTKQLADLLNRAETDVTFLDKLRSETAKLRPFFSRKRELSAWKNVLNRTFDDTIQQFEAN